MIKQLGDGKNRRDAYRRWTSKVSSTITRGKVWIIKAQYLMEK
jgi:hypothetical protein